MQIVVDIVNQDLSFDIDIVGRNADFELSDQRATDGYDISIDALSLLFNIAERDGLRQLSADMGFAPAIDYTIKPNGCVDIHIARLSGLATINDLVTFALYNNEVTIINNDLDILERSITQIDIDILEIKEDIALLKTFFEKINIGTEQDPLWVLRTTFPLYSEQGISAFGINNGGTGGGGGHDMLLNWSDYVSAAQATANDSLVATEDWVVSAALAYGLYSDLSDVLDRIGAVQTGGIVVLNGNLKIDATYLPEYVDSIEEGYLFNGQFYSDSAHTILIEAASGKIYVDIDTNTTYRYSGSAYVATSSTMGMITDWADYSDSTQGYVVSAQLLYAEMEKLAGVDTLLDAMFVKQNIGTVDAPSYVIRALLPLYSDYGISAFGINNGGTGGGGGHDMLLNWSDYVSAAQAAINTSLVATEDWVVSAALAYELYTAINELSQDMVNNTDLTGHTSNGDIHVTAELKTKWNTTSELLDAMFVRQNIGTADTPSYVIRALYPFYSDYGVSALGINGSAGEVATGSEVTWNQSNNLGTLTIDEVSYSGIVLSAYVANCVFSETVRNIVTGTTIPTAANQAANTLYIKLST